jgi:hypothetical protein
MLKLKLMLRLMLKLMLMLMLIQMLMRMVTQLQPEGPIPSVPAGGQPGALRQRRRKLPPVVRTAEGLPGKPSRSRHRYGDMGIDCISIWMCVYVFCCQGNLVAVVTARNKGHRHVESDHHGIIRSYITHTLEGDERLVVVGTAGARGRHHSHPEAGSYA